MKLKTITLTILSMLFLSSCARLQSSWSNAGREAAGEKPKWCSVSANGRRLCQYYTADECKDSVNGSLAIRLGGSCQPNL